MHAFAASSGVARVAANVQRSAGLIEPFRLAYGVLGRVCAWPISATNVVVLSQPCARPTVGCPRDDKTQLASHSATVEERPSFRIQTVARPRAHSSANSKPDFREVQRRDAGAEPLWHQR